MPDPKKLSDILGISLEVAEVLKDDKPRLLRRLQKRIDELNEAGMLQDYTIDGLDSDDAHTVDAVLYAAENVFNQEDDEEEEHSMRGG